MKPKIFLVLIFFIFTQLSFAQIMFQRHYGGTSDDYGCRVLQTDDGGYLIAAITTSYGAGGWDIYLIKINEFGDTLWTKTYGGTGDEQPNALKITSDNNYIIAGRSSSFGNGNYDAYLLKINSSGDTLWTKTYGGVQGENAYDVIQTSDEGFLLIGRTSSYTHGYNSVYAIKTNSSGDTLWTKTYEKEIMNSGISAFQLSDGGFFFCGETENTTLNIADCYFIRTNSQGDTLWTKTFGGNDFDGAFQCYDAGDGIIISGTTISYGAGMYDIFLSKFDYNGNNVWLKTYGGVYDDYGGHFSATDDGGYIITGYTESYGYGAQDMYLIKTNSNGDTLWTKPFGKNGDDWAGDVKQTLDLGYIIIGHSNSFGNGYDVYLIKTDQSGVSGFGEINNYNNPLKIFPNPSNGLFQVQLPEPDEDAASLQIFNGQGQQVFCKDISDDVHNTLTIDLTGFSKGLYLIYYSGKETRTERVIIE